MIEAFSVWLQMEKGALGLFFELNYLIGMFLTGYIMWFIHKYPIAPTPLNADEKNNFNQMYNWLFAQYVYFFFSFILCIFVNVIFAKMNKKALDLKSVIKP